MRFFEAVTTPSFTDRNSGWVYFFLFFTIYSLLAQWDWSPIIRPFFLTGGLLFCILAAAYVLLVELKIDRLLLVFIVAVIVFWLVAFPAAINGSDDNTAYLIFARDFYYDIAKTIQPLSERRLFSVGGNYAFQAPVLHWFGMQGLSLVEPVLGLVLFFVVSASKKVKDSFVHCYFLVGILALLPLGGSNFLANTASVFVLSALTFALLELGRSILEKQSVTWPEIILLMVLPLSASVFRPTTTPFNVVIAGLVVTFVFVRLKEIKKILFSAAFTLAIFYFALQPYYHIGGTYLYPILGRGFHITADGYSITASMGLREHLTNFLKTVFSDLLCAINISLAAILFKINSKSLRGTLALLVIGVYLAFYFLVVFGTGGLSSARYVFPVTLAIFVTLLITLIDQVKFLIFSATSRFGAVARIAWVVGIVGGLVLARATVGSAVVENRLKMYEPESGTLSSIEEVSRIANRSGRSKSATLLIGTGYERFIVSKLDGPYFIMDQPGMLSPWIYRGLGYAEGLNLFLIENNIRTIVMKKPDCKPSENEAYSGWSGLMQFGRFRNDHAICDLISKFRVETVDPFTVLILNSGTGG